MKHFLGETPIFNAPDQRGVSDYECFRDKNGKVCFCLRGTFSGNELRAMADAVDLDNDSFEFPKQ